MAIRSGFHRSIGEDRVYDEQFFADFLNSFIGNGVYANPSTNLQVMALSNMTTIVKPGKGWINGRIILNDSDYTIQHDSADGSRKRIDRIVLRLSQLTRNITIVVKKGENANVPVAPTLTRNVDVYELAIADVYINNGITTISQANITDTRSNTELCGYVAAMFQQLDTTTIFNQMAAALADKEQAYDADFLGWSTQKREDFDDWFETIQDILNTNVAALLQYDISVLQSQMGTKATTATYTATLASNAWALNTGTYRQTVTVTGINASDNPIISVTYANDNAAGNATIKREWSKVGKATTGTNEITFYCFGNAPTSNLTLQIKVVK